MLSVVVCFCCVVLLLVLGGWLACMIGCANFDMDGWMTPEKCNCCDWCWKVWVSVGCYPTRGVTSLWEICSRLRRFSHHWGGIWEGDTIFRRGLGQTGNETRIQEASMVVTTVVGCLECPESRISFMSRFKDNTQDKLNNGEVAQNYRVPKTWFYRFNLGEFFYPWKRFSIFAFGFLEKVPQLQKARTSFVWGRHAWKIPLKKNGNLPLFMVKCSTFLVIILMDFGKSSHQLNFSLSQLVTHIIFFSLKHTPVNG